MRIDDVWAGKEDAWHVVILSEQLALNPHSRVYAERGGSPELQGWDRAVDVATRTHNLIAGLVSAFASGSNLDEMVIHYPRAPREEPKTLAELFAGGGLDFFGQ